jgi:PemK-like, MazF-like toxin of type II toxin-antitoxin system
MPQRPLFSVSRSRAARPVKPGDIVVGAFPGAQATKIRPAVVLSTEDYLTHRADVVVGLITTQVPRPFAPTDCALLDWMQEELHAASYFRLFPVTLSQCEVRLIGRLSGSDWEPVRLCLKVGFGSW